MSRYNRKKSTKTKNYEGEDAYTLPAKLELYSLAVTSLMQPKFYEDDEEQRQRLQQLIQKNDAEFVAKLAVYAREQMYLRLLPLVLLVELAKVHNGDSLISRALTRVIQRPDEITETLAYYGVANGRTETKKLNRLSKQIQKGLHDAFEKFDEYQFAKYNRAGEVTLKDAVFLTHPKGKLIDKIVQDRLQTPYTWEVELSKRGNTKEVWEELIDSGKVGYMAMLRNLRNIIKAGVDVKYLTKVCAYIGNAKAVKRSKQLPFRFYSAYKELKEVADVNTGIVLDALEDAVLASAENIKGYDYDTSVLIACDVSGSMEKPISPHSKVQYFDIGLMLGMLLQHKCKRVITGIFGDIWKPIQMSKRTILQNVDEFHRREGEVGYSTNGYKVVEWLNEEQIKVNKTMMFTDCQLWDSFYDRHHLRQEWRKYKKLNPDAKLYLFDLTGYGNTPVSVNQQDVFFIAGWSDKVFDALDALENGGKRLQMIEEIKI